jgi:hypothetical protein
VVDAVGFTFVFAPFIANNSASLAAGILANSNLKAADICTQLLYVFWFVHNTSLSAAVLFCGSRLVKTLNKHITKFNATGERYAKVQAGIFKVDLYIFII